MTELPELPELVELLDDAGAVVGTAPKATVHHADTPLHRAFSCYVFDAGGRVLLTRRALAKRTWPGVWTNSCCGHPGPGEDDVTAVVRRCGQELGLEVADVRPVWPEFRYRAVDASGVVENEICPVYVATAVADPVPDPTEVVEWAWVSPGALVGAATGAPALLSPWSVEQVPGLVDRGVLPATA